MVTPQIFLNNLRRGYFSLKEYAMIIFYECHHANADHEELEDFFLDEAPSQQTIGGCQLGVPEKPAEKTASVHVQKRSKVERYLIFWKKKL